MDKLEVLVALTGDVLSCFEASSKVLNSLRRDYLTGEESEGLIQSKLRQTEALPPQFLRNVLETFLVHRVFR